jgi:hypothetical protein
MLEKWLNSYPAKLRWVTFGVPLAILLIGGRLWIVPDLQRLSASRSANRGESGKSTLILSLAAEESAVKKYHTQLTDSDDMTWFVDHLGELAEKAGVSLVSVSPENSRNVGHVSEVSFQIEAEAGYHALGEWISRIENSTPFIKVTKFEARPLQQRAGAAKNELRATVYLAVFRPTGELKSILNR